MVERRWIASRGEHMVTPMTLESIADDVWICDGPTVSFFGFPYPTRMAIIRLPSGTLFVWSPVALDDALAAEVEALGEVGHIVEPNALHHLSLSEWKERWPTATTYGPPGLSKRLPDLPIDRELDAEPKATFEDVVDFVAVGGSFVMTEVLFFHKPSKTLFVCDLVQKQDPQQYKSWQRWVMQLDGMSGPDGSTPREWRATFIHRDVARAAIQTAIGWNPTRMVIAHGEWVREHGAEALRSSLSWLGV